MYMSIFRVWYKQSKVTHIKLDVCIRFSACNIISEVRKISVIRQSQSTDFKDDIKTIHKVYSRLSINEGNLKGWEKLQLNYMEPSVTQISLTMVRDLLSSSKGLSFRSKLLAVVQSFPLLTAEQLPGWEVTLSRPCKAVTTAELCFITDY